MREGPDPSRLSLRADFKPDAWLKGPEAVVVAGSVGLICLSEVGGAGRELARGAVKACHFASKEGSLSNSAEEEVGVELLPLPPSRTLLRTNSPLQRTIGLELSVSVSASLCRTRTRNDCKQNEE
jgi:hypothetical protein